MRKRERGDHGAAAVEFALVLPLLLALLFGIFTGGLAFSRGIGLADGVRDGARFGATTDTGTSWASDVIQRTRELQADDFTSETAVCVDLYKNGGSIASSCDQGSGAVPTLGASSAPDPPTGLAASDCVVRVWATRPYSISAALYSFDRVMQRDSVVRYEREC